MENKLTIKGYEHIELKKKSYSEQNLLDCYRLIHEDLYLNAGVIAYQIEKKGKKYILNYWTTY